MSGWYDDDGGRLWRGPDGAPDAARTQPGAFDPLRPAVGAGADFDPYRPGGVVGRDATAAGDGMAWGAGAAAPARSASSAASGGGRGGRRGPWGADMDAYFDAFFAEPAAGAASRAAGGAAGDRADDAADPLRPVPAHVQQATQARIDALAAGAGAGAAPRGPAPVLAFKPLHDAKRGAAPTGATGPAGLAGGVPAVADAQPVARADAQPVPAGAAGGVAARADAPPVSTGAEPLRAAVVHANGAAGPARRGPVPVTRGAQADEADTPPPNQHSKIAFTHAMKVKGVDLGMEVTLQVREQTGSQRAAAAEAGRGWFTEVKLGECKTILSKKGLELQQGVINGAAGFDWGNGFRVNVKLAAFEVKHPFDYSLLKFTVEGKHADVDWLRGVFGAHVQVGITVKGSVGLDQKLIATLMKELAPLEAAAAAAQGAEVELAAAQAELQAAKAAREAAGAAEAAAARAARAELTRAQAQRAAAVQAESAAMQARGAALRAEKAAAQVQAHATTAEAKLAAEGQRAAARAARVAAEAELKSAQAAGRAALHASKSARLAQAAAQTASVAARESAVAVEKVAVGRVVATQAKLAHAVGEMHHVASGIKSLVGKQIGARIGKVMATRAAQQVLKVIPIVGTALLVVDCIKLGMWLASLSWHGGSHFGADGEGAGEGGGGRVPGQGAGSGVDARPAARPAEVGGADADGGDVDRGVAGTGTTGVDDTGVAAPAGAAAPATVTAAPRDPSAPAPTPRDPSAPAPTATPVSSTPVPATTTPAAPAAAAAPAPATPAQTDGAVASHKDATHSAAGQKNGGGGTGGGAGGGTGAGDGAGGDRGAVPDGKLSVGGAGAGAGRASAVGGATAPRTVPAAGPEGKSDAADGQSHTTPAVPGASAAQDATPATKSAIPAVGDKAAADVAGADVDNAAGADVDGAGAAGHQASHSAKAATLQPGVARHPGAAAADAAKGADKASVAHPPTTQKIGKSPRPAPARRPPTAAAIRDRRLFWGLHEDVVQVVQWRGGQLRVNQETLRAFRAMLQDGPRLSSTGAHVMLRDLKVTIGRPMGAQIPFEITYVAEARYEGGAWSPKAQDAQSLLFDVPTQRAHEVGSWHAVLFDDDAREGPALQVKNGTVVRRRREVDVPGVGVFGIVEDPKLKDGGDHYDVTVMLKPLVIEDRTATVPLNGEMVKLVDPRVKTQGFNVLLKHNK